MPTDSTTDFSTPLSYTYDDELVEIAGNEAHLSPGDVPSFSKSYGNRGFSAFQTLTLSAASTKYGIQLALHRYTALSQVLFRMKFSGLLAHALGNYEIRVYAGASSTAINTLLYSQSLSSATWTATGTADAGNFQWRGITLPPGSCNAASGYMNIVLAKVAAVGSAEIQLSQHEAGGSTNAFVKYKTWDSDDVPGVTDDVPPAYELVEYSFVRNDPPGRTISPETDTAYTTPTVNVLGTSTDKVGFRFGVLDSIALDSFVFPLVCGSHSVPSANFTLYKVVGDNLTGIVLNGPTSVTSQGTTKTSDDSNPCDTVFPAPWSVTLEPGAEYYLEVTRTAGTSTCKLSQPTGGVPRVRTYINGVEVDGCDFRIMGVGLGYGLDEGSVITPSVVLGENNVITGIAIHQSSPPDTFIHVALSFDGGTTWRKYNKHHRIWDLTDGGMSAVDVNNLPGDAFYAINGADPEVNGVRFRFILSTDDTKVTPRVFRVDVNWELGGENGITVALSPECRPSSGYLPIQPSYPVTKKTVDERNDKESEAGHVGSRPKYDRVRRYLTLQFLNRTVNDLDLVDEFVKDPETVFRYDPPGRYVAHYWRRVSEFERTWAKAPDAENGKMDVEQVFPPEEEDP